MKNYFYDYLFECDGDGSIGYSGCEFQFMKVKGLYGELCVFKGLYGFLIQKNNGNDFCGNSIGYG